MSSFTATLKSLFTIIQSTCRSILMRKVRAYRLDNLVLSGADCFVLGMLADNLPHQVMDQVSFLTFLFLFVLCFSHFVFEHILTFCICLKPFFFQLLAEISKRTSPKPDPDMLDNHNQSLLKSTTAL